MHGPHRSMASAAFKDISPTKANELLLTGTKYLDVRTVEEFAAGHPPGALNIPVMLAGAGGESIATGLIP